MTNKFTMAVLDSLMSKELGLVVTGVIEQGTVTAGDQLRAVCTSGTLQVKVKVITEPKMTVLAQANKDSGYIGLALERVDQGKLKSGSIKRGDKLIEAKLK